MATLKRLITIPPKKLKENIQRILRNMRDRLLQQKYLCLYPSGFCSGKLKMIQLTNIQYGQLFQTQELLYAIQQGTQQSFYLHLYTMQNKKQFAERIRMKQVMDSYKMVSFDVKSLFTNFPLEEIIEITLERIMNVKR